MPGAGLIRSFLEQASARGTRTTVLKPLGWMTAILVSATLSAFYFSTPIWIGAMYAVFACLTMTLYLFAYCYCLFRDRNALRSETYLIQKLAIEKGFVGDDILGPLKPPQAGAGFIEAGQVDKKEVEQ